MSGSGHTWQAFRWVIPWRVALAIDSSKHPMEVGQKQRSLRSYREQDLDNIMLLKGAIPMPPELAAQRASLAATACGEREARVYASVPQLSAASSDLLGFRHAAMSPLPPGEGAMRPPCLCQDERACLLKMKGPVVTPTPQAGR